MAEFPGPTAHQLTGPEFELLATARPAPEATVLLRRSRVSRSILLLKKVLQLTATDALAAIDLLGAADDADAEAVKSLLAYPCVAIWLTHCVRVQCEPGHRGRINAFALAAAARAGLTGRSIQLTPINGEAVVPGMGMLKGLQGPTKISSGDLTGEQWQPIRSISASHGDHRIALAVDDLDPYRNCYGLPVAPRLSEDRLQALQAALTAAWRLVVSRSPRRAMELSIGLASLVLLAGEQPGAVNTVTNQDGFGGFAMTFHQDPAEFAAILIHEFQHSKLSALASLVPLYDPTDDRTFFAPWRPDPRPLHGMLQGTYAFTAVAIFWRDMCKLPDFDLTAAKRFAVIRAQLHRALANLAGSPGLTAAGHRLVSGLTSTVNELQRVPLPSGIDDAALDELDEVERVWTANRRRTAGNRQSPK